MTQQNVHTAYRRGINAETHASAFLASKGYEIVGSRYRNALGEIDLIAKRRRHIAFVEVKARRTHDDAAWAVLPRQQRRIREAADGFLAENPSLADCSASFDVILVSRSSELVHIPEAFFAD